MPLFELNPGRPGVRSGFFCFLRGIQKLFELFVLETAVVAAHPFSVHIFSPLLIIREVVHEFLSKRSARVRIRHLCLLVVGVVHRPGSFQGNPVLFLENIIGVEHKVVEIIGRAQHTGRNIIVVEMLVLFVYLFAVPCDAAQLEIHFGHQVAVLFCRDLLPTGFHVDESPDQT